jgi:hypothetical protein
MFAPLPQPPRVAIEITSLAIYRSMLASSDRLTLMSRLAARSPESATLAVLPFRSPHLARTDGVATRRLASDQGASRVSRPAARRGAADGAR